LITEEINFDEGGLYTELVRLADESAVTPAILSPVLFPQPAKQKAFTRV
jgi:hypothetical protein